RQPIGVELRIGRPRPILRNGRQPTTLVPSLEAQPSLLTDDRVRAANREPAITIMITTLIDFFVGPIRIATIVVPALVDTRHHVQRLPLVSFRIYESAKRHKASSCESPPSARDEFPVQSHWVARHTPARSVPATGVVKSLANPTDAKKTRARHGRCNR